MCAFLQWTFFFLVYSPFLPLISPAHSVLRETNLTTLVCYLFFFLHVLIPYCELGIVLIISQSPAYKDSYCAKKIGNKHLNKQDLKDIDNYHGKDKAENL